jgi:hypothetical protein
MSFTPEDHPRSKDGTFAVKVGTAPDVSVGPSFYDETIADLRAQFPADFPHDRPVHEQVAWALRTDAEVTLRIGRHQVTENGLGLAREFFDSDSTPVEVIAVRMPGDPEGETTVSDRFLGRSNALWTQYRDAQEQLRKELPAVLGEQTRQVYPDATALVFEVETKENGDIADISLVAVDGQKPLVWNEAPTESFEGLEQVERSLSQYSSHVIETESDLEDIASRKVGGVWRIDF